MGILKNSKKYFDENIFQDVSSRSGLRPMTPNTAKVVADLMQSRTPAVDISAFNPDRFMK